MVNPLSDSVKGEALKDNLFSDVIPLAIEGIQWLESSQLLKEMIIGIDGSCANVTVIGPLEYAIHKHWLGKRE